LADYAKVGRRASGRCSSSGSEPTPRGGRRAEERGGEDVAKGTGMRKEKKKPKKKK
jgi:hypothetical protein